MALLKKIRFNALDLFSEIIGIKLPGVYLPNFSGFLSTAYGIIFFVNPQNCMITFPFVDAP